MKILFEFSDKLNNALSPKMKRKPILFLNIHQQLMDTFLLPAQNFRDL